MKTIRAERLQAAFEWPVIVAALLTLPVLVLQEADVDGGWKTLGAILNWATWGVFLAEVVVMLTFATDRRAWARSHALDIAITTLTPPFAPAAWQAGRLFRLLRLLRLGRLFSLRRLLSLEGMKYAALVTAGTVVISGIAFAAVEKEHAGHPISAWDGIWWAVTSLTTVGYGDIYPETDAGRIIAMGVFFVGIGFVALLTAFVADRFINQQDDQQAVEDQILDELQRIHARLDAIELAGTKKPPTPRREGLGATQRSV